MIEQKNPAILLVLHPHETEFDSFCDELLAQVARGRCSVRALAVGSDPSEAERFQRLREVGVEVEFLACPDRSRGILFFLLGWLGFYRKLFRLFRMYEFSLVHAFGKLAAWISIGLKIRFNVPLYWSVFELQEGALRTFAWRRAANVFCDYFFASSLLVAQQVGRSLRWRRSLEIMRPSYDVSEMALLRSKVSPRGGSSSVGPASTRVALVADVTPWSGHATVLRAVELLRRSAGGEKIELHFIELTSGLHASGSERENILQLIHEMNLDSLVHWGCLEIPHGGLELRQGDMARELLGRNIDAIVFESLRARGFDLVVSEAMAAGIWIIAARAGVAPELIAHGETGVLVRPGDANELHAALRDVTARFRADAPEVKPVSNAGVSEFQRQFASTEHAKRVWHAYAQWLGDGTLHVEHEKKSRASRKAA